MNISQSRDKNGGQESEQSQNNNSKKPETMLNA